MPLRTLPLLLGLLSGAAFAQTTEPQPQPLQRAQFVQELDAEFVRLDADGNGELVANEIAAAQRAAILAEALQRNREIFGQLDANGDGNLSAEEFARLVNPDGVPVDPAPILEQFDADRDGTITRIEYRTATQANFDRLDTDRDGIVTVEEMRAGGLAQ